MKYLFTVIALAVLSTRPGLAEVLYVSPSDGPLQAVLDAASPGDTLALAPGTYPGSIRVTRTLTLRGAGDAVLDGEGQGDVIRVVAPGVHIEGLVLRNSGVNLTDMNAAVFAEPTAAGLVVRDCTLQTGGFGIWLDETPDARVLNNRVRGDASLRSQDRGNGIHLFNVTGAEVAGNEVWETRDGIYIDTSNENVLHGNHLHDLRYGIHYMYSYRNRVTGNRTQRTRTGYALMQSKYLTVIGNRSEDDDNYGMLMNFITHSTIRDNTVLRVRRGGSVGGPGADIIGGEGKAIFIYNSLYNRIEGNRFAESDIGIHLTAGSEDNEVTGNAFVGNRTQVKYVATREQEWSIEGRGNYWTDYVGWDRNEDGLGDTPYEPNDAVDKLLWKYPMAKVVMHSPAVQTLRWVQAQFPVFRAPGVRDSHPLMKPPVAAGESGT